MREIKFRGFNGEKWLFGNLDIDYKAKHACISDNRFWRHPVRFETVGQFTGMYDADGREIYEGDVVRIDDWSSPSYIRWDDDTASFVVDRWAVNLAHVCYRKVIGNVHDNPGLLEAQNARD